MKLLEAHCGFGLHSRVQRLYSAEKLMIGDLWGRESDVNFQASLRGASLSCTLPRC
jgi:hypothetical protein